MTPKTVWAVYFSGTGTTERTVRSVAGELARMLSVPCRSFDFTRPQARQQELSFQQLRRHVRANARLGKRNIRPHGHGIRRKRLSLCDQPDQPIHPKVQIHRVVKHGVHRPSSRAAQGEV